MIQTIEATWIIMNKYALTIIVSALLALFAARAVADQRFTDTIVYADYHIVGFFGNDYMPEQFEGNVYFVTYNPRMAVIFMSQKSTDIMLKEIMGGSLTDCWALPNSNKQDFVQGMLKLRGNLPFLELTMRELAKKENKSPEEAMTALTMLKVQTEFAATAGIDLPYYSCKQS